MEGRKKKVCLPSGVIGSLFSTVPYQVPSEMAHVAAVEEGDKAQPGPGPQMPVTKKDCKGQKKKKIGSTI